MRRLQTLPVWLVLLPLLLFLSACGTNAPQPAQVVTVVNTVEVEVTRLVPVHQTVEVTREVMATQIVEVPVTVTSAPTSAATTTQPVPTATSTPSLALTPVTLTPTLPSQKVAGYAILKITNETSASLTVILNGPTYRSFEISKGKSIISTVLQGQYSFSAMQDGKTLHSGALKINNMDKYELKFRDDKVIVLPP